MKIASFDIFDTTLIRRCGTPFSIFEQLAELLYPNDTAMSDAFLLWRCQAEAIAKTKYPGKEITLTDIYSTLDTDSFKSKTFDELMDAETDMESNTLVANPSIRELI